MSAKEGTLFHCPKSDLLGDYGRVEWEVYVLEKVDLTEHEYQGIHQGAVLTMRVKFLHMFTCTFLSFYVIFRRAHTWSS